MGEVQPMGTCTKGIDMCLKARGSIVFAVNASAEAGEMPKAKAALDGEAIDLSGSFTLTSPDGEARSLEALIDWQKLEGLETFNGTLAYDAVFTLERVPQRAVLKLGDVREMACVSVNGSEEKALLLAPFEMDVTELLRVGENRVTVRVSSARVTHFDGIAWTCGLLGPVTLERTAQ